MDYMYTATDKSSAKQRVDIMAGTLRKVLTVSPYPLLQPHITTSSL